MAFHKLHSRKYLKEFRRSLRNNSTSAEAVLWTKLKSKQVAGLKFRRQHSIGNYIVDFYCPKIMLVIELDGAYHASYQAIIKDRKRDEYLESFGMTILRFENRVVFEKLEEIIEQILEVNNNITPK
ncbi:MAG: DUF559 domain-containing protein [Bacteroidales bacterium]|nr:DUF559 domain-containing protein [Bacteroidales bacterium]